MRERPAMGLARIWLSANEDDAREWKTTAELERYLQTYGLQVTKSQLDEFVRRGILSHRTREGQGRGRGITVCWPRAQCELLRTALELRRDYGARVVDVCSLPVASWAYWGDASGVPVEQVRRAMQYWAEYQWRRVQRSYEQIEQDARRLIRGIGHGGAVQKREVVVWLAERIYRWEIIPSVSLVEKLRPVIDPDGRGVARGPRAVPLSPEMVSFILQARLRALDALRQDQVPDELWEWARAFYLTGMAEYAQHRPAWAKEVARDRDLAPYYEQQTLESLYAIACKELLLCIGLGLADPQVSSLPPLWQPSSWQKGLVRVRVRTDLALLPGVDGSQPVKHFQTRLTFVLPDVGVDWNAGADCQEASFDYRGTALEGS